MNPHHYYHTQGLTDLGKLREEAIARAAKGDRVILHLHEYREAEDGCWIDPDTLVDLWQSRVVEDQEAARGHELYEEETA